MDTGSFLHAVSIRFVLYGGRNTKLNSSEFDILNQLQTAVSEAQESPAELRLIGTMFGAGTENISFPRLFYTIWASA
jgi:hypothetical protein